MDTAALPDSTTTRPPAAARVRILLVEDDPGDATLARIALRRGDGFDLHHADSLAAAIAWLRREPCDVLLLDLGLPDSQGFATLDKAKETAPRLPVIVLTGHDDPDFALKALEGGAQDYLIKGDITGGALQRAIRYAIARKALEERILQAEQQLRVIFQVAPEAILVLDPDGRITLVNPAAESMFADGAPLVGRNVGQVLSGVTDRLAEAAGGGNILGEGETLTTAPVRYAEFHLAAMSAEGGNASFLVLVQDVSDRKRAEEELKRLAVTDPLTGLPNRRRFEESCRQEMLRFQRYHIPCALIMLDIDHFKRINDSFGHPAGDCVLVALARHFHDILRATDLPARLGGEEFAILLPLCSLDSALDSAERLRASLAASPVDTHAGRIAFTVSLGVASFRPGDSDPEEVLGRADAALYRAKHNGRNQVQVEVVPVPLSDETGG